MKPSTPTTQREPHASTVHLPAGSWATVLDALCARFTNIPREQWIDRIARGKVRDGSGRIMAMDAPYVGGMRVHYQREVIDEVPIPFVESVLHVDEHVLIADKPHFLPVTPSGSFVEQTLLRRLIERTGNADLVPLHRIDRLTAGLVMFSTNRASRSAYQALFREQRIDKQYEAIAPVIVDARYPLWRRSRLVRGEPFFLTQEIDGEPNSETRVEWLERAGAFCRYALFPVTGKKHQLRVHMAALGAPILHDPWYPRLSGREGDDYQRPLKLLASRLAFTDPLTHIHRAFESGWAL
jgi:tRNA pseudouridine32 synthase / 23S rRNA pseudouridine746 synthase